MKPKIMRKIMFKFCRHTKTPKRITIIQAKQKVNKMFKERALKFIRIGNQSKISKNLKKANKKSLKVFKIVKTTMKS